MTPAILAWAEKGFKVVSENGATWKRVRLISDGQMWNTWEAPFPDPQAWTTEVDALLDQLANEFKIGRCQMLFTAEDGAGGIMSQLPHSIVGRNKNAAEFGNQATSKALSDAMRSLAETMDAVLKTAREQMAAQSLQIAADQEEIRALHDLMRAQREAEAVEQDQSNAVGSILVEQLKQAGPLAMEALSMVMAKATAKQKALADAASVAVSVKPNGAT